MIRLRIIDQEQESVEAEIETPQGTVTVVTNVRFDGDTPILYDLHVDGRGAGSLGLSSLREAIRSVMEANDIDVLEIHGFRRTTGATPGRTPKPLRFARR